MFDRVCPIYLHQKKPGVGVFGLEKKCSTKNQHHQIHYIQKNVNNFKYTPLSQLKSINKTNIFTIQCTKFNIVHCKIFMSNHLYETKYFYLLYSPRKYRFYNQIFILLERQLFFLLDINISRIYKKIISTINK